MIYIDISKLDIPEEWHEQARQATEDLRNIPENDRADFINRHSHVWQALKQELKRISYNKCWYCEAKNVRADSHVDHHRPKNKVKNSDGSEEPGYWWLAFDYRNFRLACTYCNCLHTGNDGIARGKSNSFPLAEGSSRATSPESDMDSEMPLLLDPANCADPWLLWFLDDGRACPKYPETDSLLHRRADVTIDVMNLNDFQIVEARKELWGRCMRLIERGNRAFAQYKTGLSTARRGFEIVVQEILQLINSSAEFSATARACFRGSSQAWVRETLQ